MGKQKEKEYRMPRFISSCMEAKVLTRTIVIMGFLLIAGHFLLFGRQDLSSCKYLARAFLQGDSNSGAYSVEIRTTELKEMANASKMHDTSIAMNSTSRVTGLHVKEDPNKRVFRPYGNTAYLFIQMGAYRGGTATFAVVGLASKPLHVYGKPRFECEWIPKNSSSGRLIKGKADKMLPDWGYGRVYTVVVVNCTFSQSVGTDGNGGDLILHALNGYEFEKPERIVALTEEKGSYNASIYSQAPPYDYLYCGSSLYGDLSAQRMREWMAYHGKFFGPRSHFVFHDAGGVHPRVRKVLEPWIRAGRVTVQDIREQEQYDGYYHNQFLIVNDCLHRYKFMANWTFFFDVDEYLYIPHRKTLQYVLKGLSGYTQFTIEQYSMSNKLCLQNKLHSISANNTYSREWGFEKLLFRDMKRGQRRDRKYAVQARNVYATGVHLSENVMGKTQHKTEGKIRYYHYHNTITSGEPCREFVKPSMRNNVTWVGGTPYVYDGTMKALAPYIKKFERDMMGSELESIPQ
jgi:hypothetical protein